MSDDEPEDDSFEARIRWIAGEVSRSVERLGELDVDGIANAIGVDAERAREFADKAAQWLNDQAGTLAGEAAVFGAGLSRVGGDPGPARRAAGPHPLDLPTADQGLALSALASGRWAVEPGSNVLTSSGEGPAPANALETVGELRARDWVNAKGEVTIVGQDAVRRWLQSADRASGD